MKCHFHKKELADKCMWCGKHLCTDCVAAGQGKKVYCESCRDKLGSI